MIGLRLRIACVTLASTMSVSANAACSVSASAVAFGTYNPMSSSNTPGAGTVTVQCTGLVVSLSYALTLSQGSGTYAQRKLVSGSNRLSYNIYTDAGYSSVWGDGTAGTSTVGNTVQVGLGNSTTVYNAYGLMPAQQSNAPPGTYTDTIIVTLTY